mmetsp:Transcript_16731/g.25784  ORF Transcript_16731/g.25784 Transcript_16731/m.25784 type:complete len:81 (-) Transcript_16731:251-493(-)
MAEMKVSFNQIGSNIKKEVKNLKDLAKMDSQNNKTDLAKFDKEFSSIKAKATKVVEDIDSAYEIEKTLNDPQNGDPESLA